MLVLLKMNLMKGDQENTETVIDVWLLVCANDVCIDNNDMHKVMDNDVT